MVDITRRRPRGGNLPDQPPKEIVDVGQPAITLEKGRLEFNKRRAWLIDAAGALYALKKTLMWDVGFFERDFLFRAAQEGAKEYLSGLVTDELRKDPERMVALMLAVYSQRGHGEFALEKLDLKNKTAEFSCKDSVEAWSFQINRDMQRDPVCSYASGVLASIGKMAFSEGPNDPEIRAAEIECAAQGNARCWFIVAPVQELVKRVPRYEVPPESISEHELKLNEEILMKNLELQNVNLSLERQVRRRTEELRKSEENYRSLIDLSPDPIIICAETGAITSINESALKMLGYSANEMDKAKLESLLGGQNRDWEKILWLLEKEGLINGYELELVRKDGSKLTGDISARWAELPLGKCIEIVARDVTARRSMEDQLKEARTEHEFLNDLLSHDIINYTYSALHFVANLKKSSRLSEDDRRSLSIIWKDIQGAYELASSVRDMSRVKDMDQEEADIESLQLMILEGIEEAKSMYADRQPRINYAKTPEPRFVRGYTLLSRLFTNLLTNAIKFDQSEEPEVDVVVDSANEDGAAYWKVCISDRGRGMPDAEKEKVFEKFHRLDASIEGNGLGLYVCRFIADACGGKVWAENRVEGDPSKGTTMVILLKKADPKENSARRPGNPSALLGH